MNGLETGLFLAAIAAGLASGVAGCRRSAHPLAAATTWIAFTASVALAVVRWIRSGHPPLFGTFEAGISDAAVLAGVAVIWSRSRPSQASVARGLGFAVTALLLHAFLFPREPLPLTISERSWWVDLHAAVAYAALACYLAGAAAAMVELLRAGNSQALDEAQFRFLSAGFVFHTALIASGAWYGETLFGHFWRWDPIETAAAISWLAYGMVLHARLFFGWQGRRLAVSTLLALVAALLLYKGIPHLSRALTYHSFDIVLE